MAVCYLLLQCYTMRLTFFLLLFFISISKLFASDVKFYSINSLFGTSIREVCSICKDANGFVWASSKMGILRTTERDCHIYTLPYATADVITVKLIYKNASLYAYTNNGQIFIYEELQDKFRLVVDLRKSLLENYFLLVNSLIVDDNGGFWISTSVGLYLYEDENLTLVDKKVLPAYGLTPYINNQIFYTTDDGISILDVTSMKSSLLCKVPNGKMPHVSTIWYDEAENRLWIGTSSQGLYYCDIEEKVLNKTLLPDFPIQPILTIEESSDSTIYVGIDGRGILELSKREQKLVNIYNEDVDNPYSLPGDGVYDIFCDLNDRVWVATYSGGLSYFDRGSSVVMQIAHKINSSNSLGNNHVNRVLEDSRGNIWFATNNGIYKWNITFDKWDTFYKNKDKEGQVFLALCEDDDGRIWAGSYSSGIYILDGQTGKELHHYSQSVADTEFSGEFIFDIMKDTEGDIWIGGMMSDVICYRTKEKRFRIYPEQPVKSYAEYVPGKLLLACSYGLLMLDKETGEENILLDTYLTQGLVVIDDNIWIATSGNGLICYDLKTKEEKKYTVDSGLLSDYVNSIIYANSYLWIGTENGLCRLNPIDETIVTFPFIYSLSNLSFNVNSSCKLKNGSLIWGTNNGAILFDPNMLYHPRNKGHIFYQDIIVAGRSIKENPNLLKDTPVNKQSDIYLSYNQNTVSIELIPIGVYSSGVKFSWKLEGLDEEWSSPSSLQTISYTNIPSGDFKLHIRMYDDSKSHIIDNRTLTIHVIPPFWGTWWFKFLIYVLGIGILFVVLKIYTNRLKQFHAEDKIRFFTNTAHDIRTSLTLINAPIEELHKETGLSKKGQLYLNMATEQSKRLSSVATQLLDFHKVDIGKGQLFLIKIDIVALIKNRKSMFESVAKKNNIKLKFSTNKELFFTAVDELKIEKIVDNLLSNAIKYSYPDSIVEINLICTASSWTLEIKDYGFGISAKAQDKLFREFYRGDNTANSTMIGSGIGLLLTKNYVVMHEGKIAFESKEGEGSLFKVTIPFKNIPENLNASLISDHNAKNKTMDDCELVEPNDDSLLEVEDKDQTLMIVEDNENLRQFLKLSLQDKYNIIVADDGAIAWSLIQEQVPDLVISDIMMPNMDGFELCRLVKSTFETSHIPVVLLTALSDKTKEMEGLGLGADDYITKPFDIAILTQRIYTIVKNRKVIRNKTSKTYQKESSEEPIFKNELNDEFVKKAIEVVGKNIANTQFGKGEFAYAMNVSTSLLYKKMKALTDQSPTDFIKHIRLNYALSLLQSQKYTVTEVSDLSGFSSITYFSTVFRKHFGKSPTDFIH